MRALGEVWVCVSSVAQRHIPRVHKKTDGTIGNAEKKNYKLITTEEMTVDPLRT